MICPNCGADALEDPCPSCGHDFDGFEDEELRCVACGDEVEKNDDGILECIGCGVTITPGDKMAFLTYGQGGIDGFATDTVYNLAKDMAAEGCDCVEALYVDPRHLGTGAIPIHPSKDTVDALERALKWMKEEMTNDEP